MTPDEDGPGRGRALAAVVLACVLGASRLCEGAAFREGDVLVAGAGLLVVDPGSGIQRTIPVCGQCLVPTGVAVGEDVVFLNRFGAYRLVSDTARPSLLAKRLMACDVERGPDGSPVVGHCDGTLRRVDPGTGAQTTMVVLPADTPPHFQFAFGPSGDAYVMSRKSIVRLRPPDWKPENGFASDGNFPWADLAVGARGDVFFVGERDHRVVRVDPQSGERTVVFDDGDRFHVADLVAEPAGTLLLAVVERETLGSLIFRVDATSGTPTLVADMGPVGARALASGPDGSVLVATGKGLLRVGGAAEAALLSRRVYDYVGIGPSGELLAQRAGDEAPGAPNPPRRFVRVGTTDLPDATLSPLTPAASGIALTRGGDVLLANGAAGILRVGSGLSRPEEVASGGHLVAPVGVALGPPGVIYVADPGAAAGQGAIVRVDLRTRAQYVVSAGGALVRPVGVAVARSGDVFVADADAAGGTGAVIRIDPVTGSQSIRASGGVLSSPTGIAVLPGGDVLVADPDGLEGTGTIVRIDETGRQTVLGTGGAHRSVALVPSDAALRAARLRPEYVADDTLPELCGNCVDDNGDGLVDYEDPRCCRYSTEPTWGRWQTSGRGRRRLHLRAHFFQVDPGSDPITVQVRDARGPLRCQVLDPGAWRSARRGFELPENGDAEGFKAGRLYETARGRFRLALVSRKGVVRGLRPPGLAVTLHAGGSCAIGVLRFGGGPRPEPVVAPLCR